MLLVSYYYIMKRFKAYSAVALKITMDPIVNLFLL